VEKLIVLLTGAVDDAMGVGVEGTRLRATRASVSATYTDLVKADQTKLGSTMLTMNQSNQSNTNMIRQILMYCNLQGDTGEMVHNDRQQILQGADILDPQNKLSEGEFLGEWILFRDAVETVDKSVDFNAFLLQGGKEEKALCLFIKSDPYGSQLQVVLL
jgi:hypothetical protein